MHQHKLTKEGHEAMQIELKKLEEKRKTTVLEVTRTRELGDLSENSAYRAAKSALRGIDSRIQFISKVLNRAVVIEHSQKKTAEIGSFITIETGGVHITYQLVDGVEADIMAGKLSIHSPLGKALWRKPAGIPVEYHTPKGKKEVQILSIS